MSFYKLQLAETWESYEILSINHGAHACPVNVFILHVLCVRYVVRALYRSYKDNMRKLSSSCRGAIRMARRESTGGHQREIEVHGSS